MLTASDDVFLDLVDRTKIAKPKDADIFVSVHLNSAPRKDARGIECPVHLSRGGGGYGQKKFFEPRSARESGWMNRRAATS